MPSGEWRLTEFREFSRRLKSSMRTCEIRTDLGPGYVKCLGNPEGPHQLACEWIGSRLAERIGLETLDFALLQLTDDDVPFTDGAETPGPAFVSRGEDGFVWSGGEDVLRELCNPGDIAKLVVLDTYLRNKDRHPPDGNGINKDNVYLSQERCEGDKLCLIAMDFTHALSHGGALSASLAHIDHTKDGEVYGLFEQFVPWITTEAVEAAIQALGRITDSQIDEILGEIPREWKVGSAVLGSLRTFLTVRRDFLMQTLRERLSIIAGPQTKLKEGNEK